MLITVYTDASHKPGEGSSWAYLLRYERGWMNGSGTIKHERKHHIGVCEMQAIIEGIKRALTIPETHCVLVCTDSKDAQRYFLKKSLKKDPWMRQMVDHIEKKAAEHDAIIRVRWVKGHQTNGSVKAWMNNCVDAMAKNARTEG